MIDKVFESLTIVEKTKNRSKDGSIIWKCKCICGSFIEVATSDFNRGRKKSCGCIIKPVRKGSKLYKVWSSMKDRCSNPNSKGYHNYGGREIRVCSEWMHYDNFYYWSIQNNYKEGLSIDRVNNNGNYEPTNCKWSTRREQDLNKRNNRILTIEGKSMTLTEWAEISNLSLDTIRCRLIRGWSEDINLLSPTKTTSDQRRYFGRRNK